MTNWQHEGEHKAAEALARWMHRNQFDKRGVLYVHHLERVADNVSESAKAAAWLHDVVEDQPISQDAIDEIFSEETAVAVMLLTHYPEDRTYFQYIDDLANEPGRAGQIAREVKIADLRDNLSDDRRFPGDESLYKRHSKALEIVLAAQGAEV